MNHFSTQLKDLIHVEKGIIPVDLCDHIVEELNTTEWKPHVWYSSIDDAYTSEETMELDIQYGRSDLQSLLSPIVRQSCIVYNDKYAFKDCEWTTHIMSKFSPIRFNRYGRGQIMRQHVDHIHDLFDGNDKGIPVFSLILNFNDDYEGADLFFWKDYIVSLGKGDVIMFPSLFLFPHGVTEAKKGIRYSGVAWAW